MSNVEHLIENALTAMSKKPIDTYQAFVEEMSAMYNQQMLQEVSITVDELWEIAQYLIYVWLPTIDPEELRPKGQWVEDGYFDIPCVCSNCGEEAHYTSTFEETFDYDWEENLRSTGYEERREHIRSNYCPNCGAKMEAT